MNKHDRKLSQLARSRVTLASRVRPLQAGITPSIHEWEINYLEQIDQNQGEAEGLIANLTDALIEDAIRERVTDIHLEPENGLLCLRFRVDGLLHDAALFPADIGHRLLGHIKAISQIDPTPVHRPADGRAAYQCGGSDLNLRVACVPCIAGEKIAIRLLDTHRMELSLNQLGLSPHHHAAIERWLRNIAGMFLVVGATGSGKTTTLYALLHELKMSHQSVVTIEDPIEYRIDGITQMQINDRRGITFVEGVKAMLRLDPDFLLVGEIRDIPSAHAALEVAASGKSLLSTLHSRDTAGAVTSLRNLHLQDYEIATALEMVVAQRLVRKLCPHCRRQTAPSEAEKAWLESAGLDLPDFVWSAGECASCSDTGYFGRTALFEVWHLDDDFRQMILSHVPEVALRKELRRGGVNAIIHDGLDKVKEGITSLSELQRTGVPTGQSDRKPSLS
jgi:general secretion pathway protein E